MNKEYIVIKEGIIGSIVTNAFMFSLLIGTFYVNYTWLGNSVVMQVFLCILAILSAISRGSQHMHRFNSANEAATFLIGKIPTNRVDYLEYNQKLNKDQSLAVVEFLQSRWGADHIVRSCRPENKGACAFEVVRIDKPAEKKYCNTGCRTSKCRNLDAELKELGETE